MKVVVLRERGSTVALVFMLVFMVLFLAIFGFMLLNVPEGRVFIAAFFAFFLLMMLAGIRALLKKRGEYRKAESFAKLLTFTGEGVTFPEELEFEVGTLEMKGYWVGSGRNRSYHVERKFTASRRGLGSTIQFPKREFKATVAFDGTGAVSVPAVRITDELYRDVLLLFFTDDGGVRGGGTVTVTTEKDSAQVSFRGEGKFIAGSVYATLNRARKVKVTLSAEGFSYEKVIGKGHNFEFRERMLPEEKVVMVGTYGTVSPRLVVKGFGGETIVMGHGDFKIRAVLDIPLRPDVRAEETFRVELEGEEEKEFEEEWGVF